MIRVPTTALPVKSGCPLGPLTTLELGGPARHIVAADSPAMAVEALRWARARGEAVAVLGNGSNLVVADAGFDGLALRVGWRGVSVERPDDTVVLTAAAGEPWDEVVERAVAEGWAGIECMSGIPGTVGATPVQNVGAYGQEVADAVARVRVLDRSALVEEDLTPAACGFGYRTSRFRAEPERFVILAVSLRLRPGGAPTTRYPELAKALAARGAAPSLADVRHAVLDLRRSKSMLVEPADENRRSVGSFFVNPVVSEAIAAEVAARATARGAMTGTGEMPRFSAGSGLVKLSAAWLVERAGFVRGLRRGAVGISSRHALALVHHGGGTSAELVALAREIRDGVRSAFGITLRPEPVFLGFDAEPV